MSEHQKPVLPPRKSMLGILARSILHQGILSHYRKAYWKFFFGILRRRRRHPQKAAWGFTLLLSGHHFINYARAVTAEMAAEIRSLSVAGPPANLQIRDAALSEAVSQ